MRKPLSVAGPGPGRKSSSQASVLGGSCRLTEGQSEAGSLYRRHTLLPRVVATQPLSGELEALLATVGRVQQAEGREAESQAARVRPRDYHVPGGEVAAHVWGWQVDWTGSDQVSL